MTQVGKISILAFSYYSRENEVNQGEGEIYRGKLELENAKEEGAEEEKWGLGGGTARVSWRNKEECPQYYQGDN